MGTEIFAICAPHPTPQRYCPPPPVNFEHGATVTAYDRVAQQYYCFLSPDRNQECPCGQHAETIFYYQDPTDQGTTTLACGKANPYASVRATAHPGVSSGSSDQPTIIPGSKADAMLIA